MMFIKKYLLSILLFGTLIGINETIIGSFSVPFRSVILSTITLTLLLIARLKIQKTGTSILIILIAVLFKINNIGFHSCTTNVFLCGPATLIFLGISFEVFAMFFISTSRIKYLQLFLTCAITAIIAFSLFAVMNTFILNSWNIPRLGEYILIKATLTTLATGGISMLALYVIRNFQNMKFTSLKPIAINRILGFLIIAMWLFGSYVKF
jgi:hypothetical protein